MTVGNYPGIEARIYGEKGAIICRLVEEFGVAETIKIATPDGVEFKQMEIPQRFYPTGGHARESWRSLFYANLIKDFIDEILEGGERNQGNFFAPTVVTEVPDDSKIMTDEPFGPIATLMRFRELPEAIEEARTPSDETRFDAEVWERDPVFEAIANVRGRATADAAATALLQRGQRTTQEWIEAIRAVGEGTTNYRVAPIDERSLENVLADASAPVEARAAAAVALRAKDPERLRIAIEEVADADVRGVALAEDDEVEAKLAALVQNA